jgi:hypothetical protein
MVFCYYLKIILNENGMVENLSVTLNFVVSKKSDKIVKIRENTLVFHLKKFKVMKYNTISIFFIENTNVDVIVM